MQTSNQQREPLRIRPRENTAAHPIRIENHEIFRQLIAEELRRGRLSNAERRRIVRYAAGMGLSAVDAGKLVADCREEALLDGDPTVRQHALRLVLPPERRPVAWPIRILLALNVALAIHLALRFLG